MAEINKNLARGRAAVADGNLDDARKYYELAFAEEPDNLEAEWFFRFVTITKAFSGQTADYYARLSELFYPTLKHIATLEESAEKYALGLIMVKGFPPLKETLHKAFINYMVKYRDDKLQLDFIKKVDMAKSINETQLAEDILEIFGEEKPYCLWAADIWKTLIAERYQWSAYRNFYDKDKELWFDTLGKRIKQYDPDYEMPEFKQAGCLSAGDAGKVRPGQ